MGSEIAKNWGTSGRTDMMKFDPDFLHLVTDPKHPLYNKDAVERPVPEEKIENFLALGQLEPVLVWLEGKDDRGKPNVLVVDGRQRVKLLREINKRRKKERKPPLEITAVRFQGTDLAGAMFAANAVRDEDDAITKAKNVQRYHIELGHTEEETCKVFGFKTRQTITNLLALVQKATPALQKAVLKKQVTQSAAYTASKLPADKQDAFVKSMSANPGTPPPKGRALQRAVDDARGKQTPSQRQRSVKEWKEMKARAEQSLMPASALAVFDWALGDDDALAGYIRDDDEGGGGRKKN